MAKIKFWRESSLLGLVVPLVLVMAVQPALMALSEQEKLDALDADIDGAIIYTHGKRVYKITIDGLGDWTPEDLGDGDFARWSPDGQRIAVSYNGVLSVMDADGGNRTADLIGGLASNIIPIDFHTNDTEVLFTVANFGLKAIMIDQSIRTVATYHKYYGEPSVSLDGKRMAARDSHDLYAIQDGVGDHKFGAGCSPGVSPDSAYLMNNVGDHTELTLRDWDGSNIFNVDTTCEPDGKADNHHWSNHPDYIATQGDGTVVGEIYVLKISTNVQTRVTWEEGSGIPCQYPDLYVDNVFSISGTITDGGEPVGNRKVTATGAQVIETQTNDDGEYMIVGLLDGDYTISMPGYDITGPDPIAVSGADVTGQDFTVTVQHTDGDSLDDAWEYKYFGDLTTTDGSGDADGDGKTDQEEYDAGTNPTIAYVPPPPTNCGLGGGAFAGLLVMLAAAKMLARRRRDDT